MSDTNRTSGHDMGTASKVYLERIATALKDFLPMFNDIIPAQAAEEDTDTELLLDSIKDTLCIAKEVAGSIPEGATGNDRVELNEIETTYDSATGQTTFKNLSVVESGAGDDHHEAPTVAGYGWWNRRIWSRWHIQRKSRPCQTCD